LFQAAKATKKILQSKQSVKTKGNDKITEHRAILHRERQNSQVNNRKTGKTAMALTWYRHFQRNGGLIQIIIG
jgi:hypothetical protein